MTRILADLPDDDIKWLDRIASEQGKSRASVLRDAVATYKAQTQPSENKGWLDAGFGLWARYGFDEDGMAYQSRLRNEWIREWDRDADEDVSSSDRKAPSE